MPNTTAANNLPAGVVTPRSFSKNLTKVEVALLNA
jgi:hypothetical protein